jgi:hypothetical protein
MKKLAFFLLLLFLLGFNYGCSEPLKSEKILVCKSKCHDDLDFCKRICEKEIFNPRWEFLEFTKGGAWFYDHESISTSQNFKKVWIKLILNKFGKSTKEYKNADYILLLFNFDCSERKYQFLSLISFNSSGESIKSIEVSENETKWYFISPEDELIENIFKKVCKN